MKKLLVLLAMLVLCFAVVMTASAEERTVVDSGECGAQGDNVIWTFYDDGELVISGEGAMYDYAEYDDEDGSYGWYEAQWCDYDIFEVTIEEGVTTIGSGAFHSEDELLSISIPQSVTSIGTATFAGCFNLKEIEIPEAVSKIGPYAFTDCRELTKINIPDKVTALGKCIFSGCSNLSEIIIPDGVTTIGDIAFWCCNSLTDIYIPKNVTYIGSSVFESCYNLEKIMVDENNIVYSSDKYGVLFNKDKTELIWYPSGNEAVEYVVPETVQTIKMFAFFAPFALEKLELPDSLEKLEMASFYYAFRLKELNIPASVKTMEDLAIYCINFTEINVEAMDAQFGEYAIGASDFYVDGITQDEFADLFEQAYRYENEDAMEEFDKHIISVGGVVQMSTIYCHEYSTAESYAIKYDADYVLTHFFEGDWTYDYDNMIRYRECTICDYIETEQLDPTTEDDVEIIEPVVPDEPIEEETEDDFFSKIFDLIEAFIDLIISMFKK